MTPDQPKMKPIWFFVGLVLMCMGAIVFVAGLLDSGTKQTVLSQLRPSLWWGIIMVVGGVVLYLTNRKPVE